MSPMPHVGKKINCCSIDPSYFLAVLFLSGLQFSFPLREILTFGLGDSLGQMIPCVGLSVTL